MEYADSYVMVKLSDEYAACVDKIIDEHFDNYKFYLEFDSECHIYINDTMQYDYVSL